jgi:hypothetical protein
MNRAPTEAAAFESRVWDVEDSYEAFELYYQKGWTDGLPIIPPTEARVQAMLDGARLAPTDVLANFVERRLPITAEKVAINAVMAGCLPEYMPVVVAAVKAIMTPDFGPHGVLASTAGASIMVIVNGPVGHKLGFNSGLNCLGPGNRANTTIGRAVSLITRNVCGRRPGILEKSVFGSAAKYTFCFAEDESDQRWPPLHVERGYSRDTSTVTVFPAQPGHLIVDHMSQTPEHLLLGIARKMTSVHISRFGYSSQTILMGPEALETLAGRGWTKEKIRHFLYRHATWSVAKLRSPPRLCRTVEIDGIDLTKPVEPGDEDRHYSIVAEPDAIFIVAAGSTSQRMIMVVPAVAEYKIESVPVTVPIEMR